MADLRTDTVVFAILLELETYGLIAIRSHRHNGLIRFLFDCFKNSEMKLIDILAMLAVNCQYYMTANINDDIRSQWTKVSRFVLLRLEKKLI